MSDSVTDLAPYHLAVIVASNREGRFAPTVSRWFLARAALRADFTLDVLDVADLDVPERYGQAGHEAMEAWRRRLDEADAFVVITPEYNHSYPAPLKQAIDFVNQPWYAKPVGFVGYGGVSGGLRAVEHLRNVFAELHAVTIRDSVSLHRAAVLFDEAGDLIDSEPVNAAAEVLFDHLGWYATALRTARAITPYPSA